MAGTTTPIGCYTAGEVARLAGVTPQRVGRWAREGIILPSVSTHPNLYSYADAGEAILAHYLMSEGKKPSAVRDIVHGLRKTHGDWPLATAPLAHDGSLTLIWNEKAKRYVSVDRPEHEVIGATLLNLKRIRESLKRGGWVAFKNPREYIEVDPERHSGTPVIRGRRIPTSLVASIAKRADGADVLREDYELSDAEISDAVSYEEDLAEIAA